MIKGSLHMSDLHQENKISHDKVKIQILDTCEGLGFNTTEEYRGKEKQRMNR